MIGEKHDKNTLIKIQICWCDWASRISWSLTSILHGLAVLVIISNKGGSNQQKATHQSKLTSQINLLKLQPLLAFFDVSANVDSCS